MTLIETIQMLFLHGSTSQEVNLNRLVVEGEWNMYFFQDMKGDEVIVASSAMQISSRLDQYTSYTMLRSKRDKELTYVAVSLLW
jgi:hypothetical protein